MLAQFSIFPVGAKEALAKDVAKIVDLIDKSGLPYKVGAMGTVVEGEWNEIMALIGKCHRAMRRTNRRVYTSIVIDDRKGARNRLAGKVQDVEAVLKRKLRT